MSPYSELKRIGYIIMMIFLLIHLSFAQYQLIQSFTEVNITGGNSEFGISVSGGGDVNNDGYADVIVGAYKYNSNTGRAYLYYGGNPMDNTADVVMTGEGIGDSFGFSVSVAGDVNNDTYDDVIIGAYGYNSNTGRAYLYFGGSTMDNAVDVLLTGAGTDNSFGYSLAGPGDVNKDGYDDVLVGALGANSSYIYYGGNSMDNTADVTITGETAGTFFGCSVAGVGDVNNDTYADVIVGAFAYNSYRGRAYVYYGNSIMDNTADIILDGELTMDYFGNSVSGAGDVNNDGYHDVIVGSYGWNGVDMDPYTGRAYIYFGGSPMDNTADVTITGEGGETYTGYSVSDAGDVNNDGFDDIIVGAFNYNFGTGRAYLYFGGSSMDNIVDITMTGEGTGHGFGKSVSGVGDVNNDNFSDVLVGAPGNNRGYIFYGGSSMDNISDVLFFGEGSNNYFGYSVSDAGDVNNDSYDDVIIGAPSYNSNTGRAYLYFGGSLMDNSADVMLDGEGSGNQFGYTVSGAGDVNNDGYADVIVGAHGYSAFSGRAYIFLGGGSMDNTADVTMSDQGIDNYYGWSVSGAGDVNNDGYDDVIVGANSYLSYTGRAYIYYGGGSMNNSADVTMTGYGVSSYFGQSVSGAGDVNNDNYDDVIVGANGYNGDSGRAYIYYGSESMDNTADITIGEGGDDDRFGNSVSGCGDVNHDGYNDVIVGAYNYNLSVGRVYIYYGGSSMDNTVDVTMDAEGVSDRFGYSVSGTGDVNNDTYDDVIVGAYWYNTGTGRSYIYYGGSSMDNTADIIMDGEATNDYFGWSVSGAGDVNNDGYDEVITGAYRNPDNGKAYIFSWDQIQMGFNTILSVTDNCTNTIDLIFGIAPDATDAFDPLYDKYAPPIPPGSNSDARFHIVGEDLIHDYRATNTGTIEWELDVKAASGCEPVMLQWDPGKLPADDSIFRLVDKATSGNLVDINMRSTGSYMDINDYQQFKIIYSLTMTRNVELVDGWRMIGISVDPLDPLAENLFPNMIPPLYAYNGDYYSVTEVEAGTGYWERNSVNETVSIEGLPLSSTIITMMGGWNMISGPSCPLALADVDDPGTIIIPGTLYGFDGMYFESDSILPGQGYWLRTNTAGDIIFNCSGEIIPKLASPAIELPSLDQFTRLMIGDATGVEQALYMNVELEDESIMESFSLPPLPPAGAFDARFTSDYFISTSEEDMIKIQTSHYPLSLNIAEAGGNVGFTYTITEIVGDELIAEQVLREGETIKITNPKINLLKISPKDKIFLPTTFSVSQNYPNPFNPTTQITYALPQNETVEVVIYNQLGQKVKTWTSTDQEAGYHQVTWDGMNDRGHQVASGIYFYLVRAGSNQALKKMVLLR